MSQFDDDDFQEDAPSNLRIRPPGPAPRPLKFAAMPFSGVAAPELNPNLFASGIYDPEAAHRAQALANALKTTAGTALPQALPTLTAAAPPPPPPPPPAVTAPPIYPSFTFQAGQAPQLQQTIAGPRTTVPAVTGRAVIADDDWSSEDDDSSVSTAPNQHGAAVSAPAPQLTVTNPEPLKRIQRPLQKEELATDILPYCDNCESDPATLVCIDCDEFYCDLCSKFMHLRTARRRHNRQNAKEFLAGRGQVSTAAETKANETATSPAVTQINAQPHEEVASDVGQGTPTTDQQQQESEEKTAGKKKGKKKRSADIDADDDPYVLVQRKEATKHGKSTPEWQRVHGEIKEVTKKRKKKKGGEEANADDQGDAVPTTKKKSKTTIVALEPEPDFEKPKKNRAKHKREPELEPETAQDVEEEQTPADKKKKKTKKQRLPESERLPHVSAQAPPPPPPPPPRGEKQTNEKKQRMYDDESDEELFGADDFFGNSKQTSHARDEDDDEEAGSSRRKPSLLDALNKGLFANRSLGDFAPSPASDEPISRRTSPQAPQQRPPSQQQPSQSISQGHVSQASTGAPPALKEKKISLFEDAEAPDPFAALSSSPSRAQEATQPKQQKVSLFADSGEAQETDDLFHIPRHGKSEATSSAGSLFAQKHTSTASRAASSSLFGDDDDDDAGGLFG